MPAFLVLAAIFSSLVCKKALSLMEAEYTSLEKVSYLFKVPRRKKVKKAKLEEPERKEDEKCDPEKEQASAAQVLRGCNQALGVLRKYTPELEVNSLEIIQMNSMRDTLLSKLMYGEIDVFNVDL